MVGSKISNLNIFLGIPYAEPPVGNLRFARPVPKKPWYPTQLNALRYSPACPQQLQFLRTYSFESTFNDTNEDCLYLNIFSPQDSGNPNTTYPVLFWIHGGSYRYGSGAEYDGRILAQNGVVVVTINYRLGVLVFSPSRNTDVAVRIQFPIKLSFAMSIHKSQGLTLDSLEIDCRQIFKPGQLGVALGRARETKGLRVINFNVKKSVISQPACVMNFMQKVSADFQEDRSCCNNKQQRLEEPIGIGEGFLSTDDDVAPGNYGLLDQITALKWIKDNVANFNGDPNRITILGQSAGGGSVSLHMFSPLAKGLFNSVIAQSGCALSPWAIYRPPHKIQTYTKTLARYVGCKTNSSSEIIHCLRSKDPSLLVSSIIGGPPMISTFAPRVDGYYIHDLPEALLSRAGNNQHINILNGYVPDEVAEDFETEPGIDNGLSRSHLEQLFYDKSRRYLTNADDMFTALKCAYQPSNSDKSLNRDLLINMNSDYGYVVPHIKLSRKMSAKGENVWLYEFTYRSANSLKKSWIGVPHAEELYYLFGVPFFDFTPCPSLCNVTCPVGWGKYQNWTDADKQVSLQTMKLWTDFARLTRNMTSFPSRSGTQQNWSQFSQGEIILNISTVITQEHLRKSNGVRFFESFNYLNVSERIPDVCNSLSSIPVGK